MKYPLSDNALAAHTAFLGKTGSGKTTSAKGAIEHIVRQDPGARVCIFDPIKSDWWGITSSADGKRPGLPFTILGGPHGHVPLHDTIGAAVGELVATGALPLSIIDMADFGAGGLQRFFNDFVPVLMRKMRGVLHLVLEEAHEFAPKERAGFGGETMAIHFAKKLATAGRSKGIRLMVVSQSTQQLHNRVLGSCETMVAHRFIAPADQRPIIDWLKANAPKDAVAEVAANLAKLKTGTAYVASGEEHGATLVHFPPLTTFDNSATPDANTRTREVTTAPVDRERLKAIMGTAAIEAEANDPAALKKRIAELEARSVSETVSAAQIEAARKRGWDDRGREDRELLKTALIVAKIADRRLGDIIDEVAEVRQQAGALIVQLETSRELPPDMAALRVNLERAPALPQGRAPVTVSKAVPAGGRAQDPAEGLTGPMVRILNALAELAALGVREAPRIQVVFLAGYGHPNSKGFVNALGALSTGGYVTYPRAGIVALTDKGASAGRGAVVPLTSADLQARVLDLLGAAHGRILRPLIDAYPGTMSRQDLCAAAGYGHMNSKGFVNAIGRLRSLGFIDYPATGQVVALPILFVG